jgi:hypothetical protein
MVTNQEHAKVWFAMKDLERLCSDQAGTIRQLHQAVTVLRRQLATANETIFSHAYDKR